MRITIITVVFNNRGTIGSAIESVLSQTHPDIEYIVVDGASTDGTVDIIKSYGSSIAKVISEPDKGIYDAMNKGIRMASGEIVGILNSDDFYVDGGVLSRVDFQFSSSACEALYGDLEYVDGVDTDKVLRKWKAGRFRKGAFLYGWMPPHPTFFVRRELYERYGLFDQGFRSAADYELMLRFLFKYNVRVAYLPEKLVRMRAGGISNASLANRARANREDRRAWTRNGLKPFFFTTWLKPIRKIGQFRILHLP